MQDCASNATIVTNVSPFNSQIALLTDSSNKLQQPTKKPIVTNHNQQHYYAENLRNSHHRTLNGSQIYDPLRKEKDFDYQQLDPLLRRDEPSSDTRAIMESQDFKIKSDPVMKISQFEKERRPKSNFSNQVSSSILNFLSSRCARHLGIIED